MYPKDIKLFWQLVKLGSELRQIHLLESDKVEDYIAIYPEGGDNVISRKIVKKGWELYDPEKQLGRKLSYEDILHYQKIIIALTETDRLMKEIDKISFE